MRIEIDKYVISGDGRQYTLCVPYPSEKNPDGLRIIGYFHEFGYLVADLVKKICNEDPGIATLAELRDKIERIAADLSAAIETASLI